MREMASLAELAELVAIISACWAIISGVGAWKREFIGKRQIELAEETLAKFFEIKDAIAYIRNPFGRLDEGKTRERSAGESATESELLDRGYVVIERYTKKESIFVEFNAIKYKFMATFGANTENIFVDTNKALNSIFISARMLASHYWQRQGRVEMQPDEFQRHLNEMHRHQGIFWDTHDENDEIRRQLTSIQKRFEEATADCFKEPMKTYSILTYDFLSASYKRIRNFFASPKSPQ